MNGLWFTMELNLCRFQNSQFHHVKNGKKKFRFPNADKGRGLWNLIFLPSSFINYSYLEITLGGKQGSCYVTQRGV